MQCSRKTFINLYQSEIQYISGAAVGWNDLETGGDLYGLFTHAERPAIMLATPPGPNAVHEKAHFQQDIEYLEKSSKFIQDNHGLQYCGNWHSHHYLNIKGLSKGDILSSNSIASKNGYRRMCQLLITFEPFCDYEQTKHKKSKNYNKSCKQKPQLVRFHTFLYIFPSDQPIKCPIRILPGISPFRKSLKWNPNVFNMTNRYKFPLSQIYYDSIEPASDLNFGEKLLPNKICRQLSLLPVKIQKDTTIQITDDFIILMLPLLNKEIQVLVTYGSKFPYKLIMVYINHKPTGSLMDISSQVFSYDINPGLDKIYKVGCLLSLKGNSSHVA